MKSEPQETIEISGERLSRIEDTVAPLLNEDDQKYLHHALSLLLSLIVALQKTRVSIKQLKEMLFGRRSEKTKDVLGGKGGTAGDAPGNTQPGAASDGTDASGTNQTTTKKKKKPKGHGRNAAAAYTGAKKVHACSTTLKPGAQCPECGKGKVYELAPKITVNVIGQAPLGGTVYSADRWRCNLCLKIFTTEPSAAARPGKYDETCASTIALLKYGSGLPFNRIEALQGAYGIPLPSSTQWDLVNAAAQKLQPVYEEMIRQAAQGDVLHNDDTTMRILSLMGQIKGLEVETSRPLDRSGIFTTGIMSIVGERTIGLFFTGWRHAGENLAQVLADRDKDRETAIQMCDALSRNTTAEFETILANCMAHARREFVPLATIFPDQVRRVLEALRDVYRVDGEARRKKLSAAKRLILHQTTSGPIMRELKAWLDEKIEGKTVEPNSPLGGAISYMIKHWKKLTLFLREAGAPLDNNVCERLLKKAILNRKNSLFYRTEHGARVGDLFMSLIYTAKLASVSPFHYLTELQKHAEAAALSPENWMPWNYLGTIANERLDQAVSRNRAG